MYKQYNNNNKTHKKLNISKHATHVLSVIGQFIIQLCQELFFSIASMLFDYNRSLTPEQAEMLMKLLEEDS